MFNHIYYNPLCFLQYYSANTTPSNLSHVSICVMYIVGARGEAIRIWDYENHRDGFFIIMMSMSTFHNQDCVNTIH